MAQQLVDMTAEEHGGDPASRCVDGVWRELRRSRGEASTCSHCCVVAAAAAAAIVTTATSVIVTVTAGARGRSLRSSRRDDPGAGVAAVTSMHSKSSNSLPSSNALCVGILAGVTVAAHTAALAACATLVVLVARVAVTLAAAPAQPSLRRLRPLRPRRSACLPHRCALIYARGRERAYASPRAACVVHARACFAGAPPPSRRVERCVGTRWSVERVVCGWRREPCARARAYAPPRAACFVHARACFAGAPPPSRCVERCVRTRSVVCVWMTRRGRAVSRLSCALCDGGCRGTSPPRENLPFQLPKTKSVMRSERAEAQRR